MKKSNELHLIAVFYLTGALYVGDIASDFANEWLEHWDGSRITCYSLVDESSDEEI